MITCPRCDQPLLGDWVLLGGQPHHLECAVEAALEVLKNLGESALVYKHVVAAGVGFKFKRGMVTREVSIIFNVDKKVPAEQLSEADLIPPEINGVRTDVIETGAFTAPPPPAGLVKPRKGRVRPLKGGASVSHIESSISGTIGGVVKIEKREMLISANHAVALLNDADPGDAIVQPSKEDGGGEEDVIGALDDFSFIEFGPKPNKLDAATIEPIKKVSKDIIGIGKPKGVTEPLLNMLVTKSGRTTGVTTGNVIEVGVVAFIVYPGDRGAVFENQILITGWERLFAAYGDGGSFVVDADTKRAVGLLFAASTKKSFALATPMRTVLEFFGAEM